MIYFFDCIINVCCLVLIFGVVWLLFGFDSLIVVPNVVLVPNVVNPTTFPLVSHLLRLLNEAPIISLGPFTVYLWRGTVFPTFVECFWNCS